MKVKLLIKNFSPADVLQALGEFVLKNEGVPLRGETSAHLRTTVSREGVLLAVRLEIELPEPVEET